MTPTIFPLADIFVTDVVPVNVGLVDKTLSPVPVTAVAPVPPLLTGKALKPLAVKSTLSFLLLVPVPSNTKPPPERRSIENTVLVDPLNAP